jgi:hypothetical protein
MPQRKFFVATGTFVFDFKLFMGVRSQKIRAGGFSVSETIALSQFCFYSVLAQS